MTTPICHHLSSRLPSWAGSNAGTDGGLLVYSMSNKAKPLPMEIIRESFELDPSSRSWLRWKVRPISHFSTEQVWKYGNLMCAGKEAGWIHRNTPRTDNDYFVVRVAGRLHLVHRIVYFLATGEDPVGFQIDHIDGNGLNNNPSNLRLATAFENQRNRRTQKTTPAEEGVSQETDP